MRFDKSNVLVIGILSILLIIFVSGLIWVYISIPIEAEKQFGPADETFSINERFTYSSRMLFLGDDLLPSESGQNIPEYFIIEQGESIQSISERLEQKGLIRKAEVFRLYLLYSGLDRSIQAGEHKVLQGMDTIAVAKSLQSNQTDEVKFNILAGWRLEEIAAALPTSGLKISPDQFLEKTKDTQWVVLPSVYSEFQSFEGLLLPGNYIIKRNIEISALLSQFLQTFDQSVNQEIRLGFKQQGLSLKQGVILASIVEREAMVDEEKPLIASVFINRINSGMKLESDPTVQYAIGYVQQSKTWWKNPLTTIDLEYNSPYNSYAVAGLPPAPICNPGLKALKAIAFPKETTYYFFRAKCDQSGKHEFSETYEEHAGKSCP